MREKQIELESGVRRCTGCRCWKPLDGFYRTVRELRSTCKDCDRDAARKRAAEVRERRRQGDEHLRTLRREQKRRARARAAQLR